MAKIMKAKSLDDIAEHFEQMAENAARSAAAASTEKMRALWRRESSTWMQAAHTLRQTDLEVAEK